jgi:hypothetical protein
MRVLRRAALIFPSALLAMLLAATAASATRVTLSARFDPDIAGQSTTILYKFEISKPLPVESVDLHLPAGMELATSSLGLSECNPTTLEEYGPEGCPPDSIIGHGTAFAEVPLAFAPHVIHEPASVTAVFGPAEQEDPTILFFVEAIFPVYSSEVLSSRLTLSSGPFSASLTTSVPLLDAWTEGPAVALTRFHASIGPQGITYHRREHGHLIAFHPRGLSVPSRCPPKGFPFRVEFHFYNDTNATANSRAPCPKRRTPPASSQQHLSHTGQ